MTPRATVVHYTGHRITGLHGGGFDPALEESVARAIGARIDGLSPVAAFGSLASGADILFAEAFIARGVALNVWLPCGIRRFQMVSVQPAGELWVRRYKRALAGACQVTTMKSRGTDDAAFAACTRAAICGALDAALAADAGLIQIAVWDGEPAEAAAGTAADVAAWRSLGLPTEVVYPLVDAC